MFKIKWALFFLKWSWGTNWTLLFLHVTPISGSYSSDFAYWVFSQGAHLFFSEILDLSSPNT